MIQAHYEHLHWALKSTILAYIGLCRSLGIRYITVKNWTGVWGRMVLWFYNVCSWEIPLVTVRPLHYISLELGEKQALWNLE